MAAANAPQKTQAQLIAESTWASYSQLLAKGDAGILKLYVCDLFPNRVKRRVMDFQCASLHYTKCADCQCSGSK